MHKWVERKKKIVVRCPIRSFCTGELCSVLYFEANTLYLEIHFWEGHTDQDAQRTTFRGK